MQTIDDPLDKIIDDALAQTFQDIYARGASLSWPDLCEAIAQSFADKFQVSKSLLLAPDISEEDWNMLQGILRGEKGPEQAFLLALYQLTHEAALYLELINEPFPGSTAEQSPDQLNPLELAYNLGQVLTFLMSAVREYAYAIDADQHPLASTSSDESVAAIDLDEGVAKADIVKWVRFLKNKLPSTRTKPYMQHLARTGHCFAPKMKTKIEGIITGALEEEMASASAGVVVGLFGSLMVS